MEKSNKLGKVIQGAVTMVLFVFILFMIHNVNSIQGTARVVNYAGLVRGATQRMIKLEITGNDSQGQMQELDSYVDGIQHGSKALNLVKIEDDAYQEKAALLGDAWKELKQEIEKVRESGYAQTDIVEKSEAYFVLSDQVVGLAERYSEQCATNIRRLEIIIIALIIVLVVYMIKQSLDAIRVLRMNRDLKEKVFWDEQTNLPNKNKCIDLLDDPSIIEEKTTVFMFDLNNLKYINDHVGHDAGDVLIQHFSQKIREGVPQKYFVGRYGGDEFIAILTGADQPAGEEILRGIQEKVDAFNQAGEDIQISYAAGFACSDSFDVSTLRILLSKADQEMYENKKLTKKEIQDVEDRLDNSLSQMVQALGNAYRDCCYCNAKSGNYRLFKHGSNNQLPVSGVYEEEVVKFIETYVDIHEQEEVLKLLSMEYIRQNLNEKQSSYDVICQLKTQNAQSWWKFIVMFGDKDDDGSLFHFIVVLQEITDEVELEYEAKHDGLTRLWNKTTAFAMMSPIALRKPEGYHVMFVLDLDNFKTVNDNMGHHIGDQVLKETADIIQFMFRTGDITARFGGDEFVVFATNVKALDHMQKRADQILHDIRQMFEEKYAGIHITISIGIAYSAHPASIQELFHAADEALYEAKHGGKNQIRMVELGNKN